LLAAGVGRRLGPAASGPKVLLSFGGKTLLERHLMALQHGGLGEIAMTVGFQRDAIERELRRLHLDIPIHLVGNRRYREGSLFSLWLQAERLRSGASVILMDGDVLYDPTMIDRLLSSPAENVLLVDRRIEPGDEPVKICFRGEQIVDFGKVPDRTHDWHGESVGFFRFSSSMAFALADRCAWYVEQGRTDAEYELAIRDLILAEPDRFSAIDVSDLSWTEIDFPEDVQRAQNQVLPKVDEIIAAFAEVNDG
jgi:choline kinase